MAQAPEPDDPQSPLVPHLRTIERVTRYVCRRNHLTADEAEDFASHVHVRLLADDCAALRRFGGRSNIQTYLSVVIERYFIDYRREIWGKWRPSAEAVRVGAAAVLLDKLMTRDGYSVDEAYQIMTVNHRMSLTRAEVDRMASALPPRSPRRFESDENLADRPAPSASVEQIAAEREVAGRTVQVAAALRHAFAALDVQDRLILVMRFHDNQSVPQISAVLGIEQQALYRRIVRLLNDVKQHLERQGIDRSLALQVLESDRALFELSQNLSKTGEAGPSVPVGARKWR
jgi:RNA polymerase sigma factor (sigma-70 family)